MFSTDGLEYGAIAMPSPGQAGFSWVYPTRCGYGRMAAAGALCEEAGGLVVYVLSGVGEAVLAGEVRRCEGGCAVVAQDARELTLRPEGELVYFYLLLQNAGDAIERLGERDFVLSGARESRADRLLGRIYYNACAGGAGTVYEASADAFALLMELLGHAADVPEVYTPLVRQTLLLLREEYVYLSGVDELAERMGVSKSHLIRCFTAAVGISPGKYLQEVKLENAKLMLQNRDYSVETVADMVGYSGANYFCKVFRRATGESPGAYRARQAAPALDADSRRRIDALEGITHV